VIILFTNINSFAATQEGKIIATINTKKLGLLSVLEEGGGHIQLLIIIELY
jgi:hypothetical protein